MTDKEFLRFLQKRNNLLEERYNRPVPVKKGQGLVVKGTVFDVNRKNFERALKDLDPELFVVWNPYRKEGVGCWQIWIKPLTKTPVYQTTHEGNEIHSLEYKYIPVEHHIMDLDTLNYDVIEKLRKMRVTVQDIENADYEARRKQVKEEEQYLQERKYAVRHTREIWKAFHEYVKSGYNPMWFFDQNRKSLNL